MQHKGEKALVNCLWVARKLSLGETLTTRQIADRRHISQRTAQRYLNMLLKAGYPIYDDPGWRTNCWKSLKQL